MPSLDDDTLEKYVLQDLVYYGGFLFEDDIIKTVPICNRIQVRNAIERLINEGLIIRRDFGLIALCKEKLEVIKERTCTMISQISIEKQ